MDSRCNAGRLLDPQCGRGIQSRKPHGVEDDQSVEDDSHGVVGNQCRTPYLARLTGSSLSSLVAVRGHALLGKSLGGHQADLRRVATASPIRSWPRASRECVSRPRLASDETELHLPAEVGLGRDGTTSPRLELASSETELCLLSGMRVTVETSMMRSLRPGLTAPIRQWGVAWDNT
jgi:hypothetical protein